MRKSAESRLVKPVIEAPRTFADADLLGPSFGSIAGETEEAKAGDKDGEGGKDAGELAGQGFGLELVLEFCVHEFIFEGIAGIVGFDDAPDSGEGFGDIGVRLQPDVRKLVLAGSQNRMRGAATLVHIVIDKVFTTPMTRYLS